MNVEKTAPVRLDLRDVTFERFDELYTQLAAVQGALQAQGVPGRAGVTVTARDSLMIIEANWVQTAPEG